MLAVKGAIFEVEISSRLKAIPKSLVLPNFKIYSHYLGKKTEIDRLLVTPWAAYSIEAKSYTAILEGTLTDEMWIGRSKATPSYIYNPVLQNFEHIRSLNANLRRVGLPYMDIQNIIVVPDSCRITSNYKNVYNLSNFLDKVISDSCSEHKYPMRSLLVGLQRLTEVLK